MKSHILTRAAFGAAASVSLATVLAGCSGGGEPSPTTTAAPTSTGGYTDGTYTARGVYGGAPSHMDFTVTIEDDLITDVESELMEDNNDTSRGYQERFAAALPDEVVGESIDDVEVGFLAGSSSCGDGFNDAVEQIREEARDA
ncbi:hypothetical protein ACT3SZ_12480 [Corynebacterium sp. AOP40-9SA-29]|uniref:hypothetical protein n=1 Tax=Corynebacterium sp. AOP40-9SA-29 TaxID=3457677 RepID=UPI004033715E